MARLVVLALTRVSGQGSGGEDCAEITIEPVSGPIGTEHIIDFTCFQANESVKFFIEYLATGERVYEARVKTDSSGDTFTSIITEPGDAAGVYRITAEGEGGQIAIAEFSIE